MSRKAYDLLLTVLLLSCAYGMLTYPSSSAVAQMSDTCSDGRVIVMDATNKRYKCVSADLPLIYRAKGLNVNQTATDIGSFTNLPARYIVRRLYFENASTTPALSTVDLRTASGGGGTAIAAAVALSSLTTSSTLLDATLAVTSSVQTVPTLTLRAVAAAGTASTIDVTLEVVPLQ